MDRAVERTDRVRLAADVARCEPSLHCAYRMHCARYMATIPAHGGAVMDGTASPLWSPSGCAQYIPAADHVKKQYTGPERRAKPWPQVDSEW